VTSRTGRPTDLPLGILTLAIALAYYRLAAAIPSSDLADAVGPQGLPKAYAVVLGALSAILVVRVLLGRHPATRSAAPATRSAESATPVSETTVSEPSSERPRAGRAVGMLLIGVGYIALVPYVGYVLGIATLIASTAYYQGGVMHRRVAAVGVSGALLLWVLFVVVLGIAQPTGVWPSIF
jgi:putative tricarboxylic transport membrane protein